MDQPWENVGPCNCSRCGIACHSDELRTANHLDPELYCAGCIQTLGEQQDEADADAYFGGESVGSYGPSDERGVS